MRKFLLSCLGIASLAVAGAANAADIPRPAYKAPPPPVVAPIYNWSGIYIGGHVGAGWGNKWWNTTETTICELFSDIGACSNPESPFNPNNLNIVPGNSLGTTSVDGFLGGGQVGFNWQTGLFVWGVEADASWTNMKGQFPCIFTLLTCSSKIDWIATVVGRVGVTVLDRILVYGGGGGAWAHEKDRVDFFGVTFDGFVIPPFSFSGSDNKWGWTFLAGTEYAFLPNWSVKLQYNYYQFGRHNVHLTQDTDICAPFLPEGCIPPGTALSNADTQLRIHSIKLGLNYRFTWGKAPVVASY